jgi:hypothetical protein
MINSLTLKQELANGGKSYSTKLNGSVELEFSIEKAVGTVQAI